MAVPPYPYRQPRNNTLIIVVAVVVMVAVILIGGVIAIALYTPAILRTSTGGSNNRQDPAVTSATLVCTGTCDLSAQFSDDNGQSRQIAQNGRGSWTIQRPFSSNYWLVEWQISLRSTGSIAITLNTGYALLQVEGPTNNQGSWSTSSGQY